jgi:hypothetical protein
MTVCCGCGPLYCGSHTSPPKNSVLNNAAEIRLQSRHVVGVPMENRHPMTRRDGASVLALSNDG